ncbi:hypothetical protein ACO0KY_01290 [Undibacterium sp. Dicai25W]|uniref:hypothetical protein n=1 Tax=Undibacterium sp. Dicai25W TaxID=3413034 RepID=UPI003BEFA38B
MKVFLNERSIPEKAIDPQEIYIALNKLIHIAANIKKISNNQQIKRDRDLKNKEVLVGQSLVEYIIALGNHPDPNRKKVKALFLELFAKAPFLSGFHDDNQTITDLQGQCLKYSCFDDASACRTGAAVISAEVTGQPTDLYISIKSSMFGQRKILNISNIDQLNNMLWVYQSNEKHEIPKDFIVDGEIYSAMQLSNDEAQRVLSNGVMIGKCVFNKVGGQWYKFHCHEKNIYHGFPITVKTPYKDFSSAHILFEEIQSNEDGQLLEELLVIRNRE